MKIVKTTLLATLLSITLGGSAMAADYRNNPFTLTYDNALTENVKGMVNIHPVKYTQKVTGIEVVANVYTPANYDTGKKYPVIVVAHPNGGVKEQVAGLYAQNLAEQGYITIAFDAAYQGGSSGVPRYTDKPQNRIEDIRAAADFITQYPGADADQLGLLGICGGGGYSIKAAETDKRFKTIATISLFNSGKVRRNGFMDSQKETIEQRLADIAKVRAMEAKNGEIQYTPSFGQNMTKAQVDAMPFELYRQGYEYYAQTHAHPNSQTNSTIDSLQDLMEFDANTNVDLINQPLLMIAGEKADSLYMTEEIFANATGTSHKSLVKIPNATHMELYWKQPYVKQITDKLTQFYGENLK